jgi:hypothetical protein
MCDRIQHSCPSLCSASVTAWLPPVVRLLLHSCCNAVTLLLHCHHTVVTLSFHYCYLVTRGKPPLPSGGAHQSPERTTGTRRQRGSLDNPSMWSGCCSGPHTASGCLHSTVSKMGAPDVLNMIYTTHRRTRAHRDTGTHTPCSIIHSQTCTLKHTHIHTST